MKLTSAQERAATTIDRPVAVTAGPGSGKTRVLVARYLEILESGRADIENIVAITFTKKAASEMRDRVRREMEIRAVSSPDAKSRAAWRQRRRKLDSAVITTIHGFCSRLLREHPVEAGIDPQFVTLDSFQESVMTDYAAHAAVTGAIDEGSTLVAELVASYSRAGLVRAIERVHKTARSLGIGLDVIVEKTVAKLASEAEWREAIDHVDATVSEGLSTVASLPYRTKGESRSKRKAEEKFKPFADFWRQSVATLLDPSIEGDDGSLLRKLDELARLVPSRSINRRLKPFVSILHEHCGGAAAGGALYGIALDLVARAYLPILSDLVAVMATKYAEEKRLVSALDFEDLQLGVRRLLSESPDVARRARARYTHFLVDEYQDTNGLQRDIVREFVEGDGAANLFVVGDPKQSIYGFRGAEVAVFAETSRRIEEEGGERVALATNFRSDGRLVNFVSELFDRLMAPPSSVPVDELESLGHVGHSASEADHVPDTDDPVVELVLATRWIVDGVEETDSSPGAEDQDAYDGRDREARMLAERLRSLVESGEPVIRTASSDAPAGRRACRYGDVALLLRTRSHVKAYERALRNARVPFYVVAGKGFYDRPETRDLLEVLRFLDNATDELALAAVLRSPLFGISDETLLALRADRLGVMQATGRRPRSADDRPLWLAVLEGVSSPRVDDDQRKALVRASDILRDLRALRNRLPVSDLLREIVRRTQIDVVLSAADDGAQRLSNIEKLVTVARAFGRGSGRLLGDFTEYVRDFNRLDSDEAEANVRSDADAVAVMTVHKSKGLEFPVVAIADLQGHFKRAGGDVLLDRELGLGFRVPDGTARRLPTRLHGRLAERLRIREQFEAMRALFVAVTRAEDRLILSASDPAIRISANGVPVVPASKDALSDRSWLAWLLRAIAESGGSFDRDAGEIRLGEARLRLIEDTALTLDSRTPALAVDSGHEDAAEASETLPIELETVVARVERLMAPLAPTEVPATTRFGVTSLLGFATCPRRFLFGRLLRIPELSDFEPVRDVSERSESGHQIPPSLRGLVAHRFCEMLQPGESVAERLHHSVADVRRERGDAYADIFAAADDATVAAEVAPLAASYAESRLRKRVDVLSTVPATMLFRLAQSTGRSGDGFVVSEMGFSLRFDDGSVVGFVDKLLLEPDGDNGWSATVVDFKTNRVGAGVARERTLSGIESAYRMQMQAYALAVRRLVPNVTSVSALLVALSAGPDVDISVDPRYLEPGVAEDALGEVLGRIRRAGVDPQNFPARTGPQCLTCAHLQICPDGLATVG